MIKQGRTHGRISRVLVGGASDRNDHWGVWAGVVASGIPLKYMMAYLEVDDGIFF